MPVARAVPALALSVVVAFTPDHSAPLGYVSFGVFAVVTGAILAASGLRLGARGVTRSVTIAQGLVSVVAGIVALALPAGGLPFFVFLLSAFAAITGFLELYLGLRGRGRDQSARDWVFVGGLTVVLAIVMLLVPPEFQHVFSGPDDIERELTASVIIVGALGAYWAIVGVYLVIAGLSLKWAKTDVVAPVTEEASR